MSSIYSIVYQPKEDNPRPNAQFYRVSTDNVYLIAGYGIEDDAKAGRNPNRQINILSSQTLHVLEQHGFKTNPGEMGEQMIIDGLDMASLKPGDRLSLGNDAVVEVTFPRTSCKRLEQIQNPSQPPTDYDLGIFVRVISSGEVYVGDQVKVVKKFELMVGQPQ